jgi:hypothetical protein
LAVSAAAHRRGPLPPCGRPAPARWRSRRHAPPVAAPARANRAVLPRRASCRRARPRSRARPLAASLRFAPGRPLTASFPGKIRHRVGGRERARYRLAHLHGERNPWDRRLVMPERQHQCHDSDNAVAPTVRQHMPGEFATPTLTDFESKALVDAARRSTGFGGPSTTTPATPSHTLSEEERRKAEEEARQERRKEEARRAAALNEFVAAVNERLANAYNAGANEAVDRADRNNFNARSITLYLVVLAVVAMPAIAMIINLSPQAFGSYIAPVTGIAGTVVGYWFGTLNRQGRSRDSAQ